MSSPSGKVSKYAGGNSACDRPTPEWQKGIGAFFKDKRPANKEKENQPENANEIQEIGESSAAAPAAASSSSSCSQGSSGSGTSSSGPSESSEPSESSQVVRNGIVDSDEDDE